MGFIKTGSVETLAVALLQEGSSSLHKTAAYEEENTSAFLNQKIPLDIQAALKIVASEYDISDNPSDYFFEAIRGNTANVPNENKDAFHKNELLRFDHRLGKQDYRTYELKPHHINHRAENPLNARGFILDAHYNDHTPPLETCPNENCGNKTASRDERDETGIHCRKCGTVVKDEFVELLVAIDTRKDPTFAKGVQAGILKHGSMGCSCLRTRCNVCSNVAYSRNEFCAHIRNKGKEYDDTEPGFNPVAFTIKFGKDRTAGTNRKTARAFEWCEGVIYDEYSRVHDPADVKAEQYEILKLSERVAQLTNEGQLQNESEILILQSKLADLERKVDERLAKVAQAMPPMPPPPPGLPPPGSDAPPPDLDLPLPGGPGEEKAKGQGDVTININTTPEGVEVSSDELEETSLEKTPIEDLKPEDVGATPAGPGGVLSPAAMGISEAPGAATPPKLGNKETTGGPSMLRFADSYKHLKAEITKVGNVRIYDDDGTLFVVKPGRSEKTASIDSEDLAKKVLTMVAQYGLGTAIHETKAIVGPRLAQVLEHYHDDMMGDDRGSEPGSVLDADMDTKDKRPSYKDTATGDGSTTDRKEDYDDTVTVSGNDALNERETDMEDEQHDRDAGGLSVTEMKDSDMRDKRDEFSMGDSSLDDATNDMRSAAKKCKECSCDPCECKKEKKKKAADSCDKCGEASDSCGCVMASYDIKQHAARIEALYKGRLDKKIAELEEEKKQFVANLSDRFARALKLVARRQALNLEYSPMKTAMGIALCNPTSLGDGYEYAPMDQRTAVTLVESAFNEPIIDGTDKPAWEASIDGMIERAAAVMGWNDETLMQIESDLQNIKVAAVPLDEAIVRQPHADMALRTAANRGNLQLNPNKTEEIRNEAGDRRQAIRSAVGVTKVAGLANLGK